MDEGHVMLRPVADDLFLELFGLVVEKVDSIAPKNWTQYLNQVLPFVPPHRLPRLREQQTEVEDELL